MCTHGDLYDAGVQSWLDMSSKSCTFMNTLASRHQHGHRERKEESASKRMHFSRKMLSPRHALVHPTFRGAVHVANGCVGVARFQVYFLSHRLEKPCDIVSESQKSDSAVHA